MLTWLEGKADNRRRAYTRALQELLADRRLSDVELLDVAAWKEDMECRGLADATVAQRLSAISSYYTYPVQHGIYGMLPWCRGA